METAVQKLIKQVYREFDEEREKLRRWAAAAVGRRTAKAAAPARKLDFSRVTPQVKEQVHRLADQIVQGRLATVEAAALALQRTVLRPTSDLKELLLREVGPALGAESDQAFESALAAAKRTIFADVASGIR